MILGDQVPVEFFLFDVLYSDHDSRSCSRLAQRRRTIEHRGHANTLASAALDQFMRS
jgi:ATP-dependent DNA ligase